ncbi:MAG: hypothetical protein HOM68_24135 [Gemmatimonadetes bacterium]|jgi:hypothetical protein|nr:hypothetical protein [Gemmatimonadota bacterium]MBT5059657.1 hypothetical protein [Gemmatimonadota bacterium]MBT5146213.1 hypothetical protein [Gemmatimonadota bacterium]MBT5587571.1 hypothetical protein [Gemmatimonadota bacterium]MBT5965238.1 hypothetical protein [Gemmatimonadota bacterium]
MTFNHINRRLHLYLSMSLLPWFLVYALSSLAIQHRSLFTDNPRPEWTPRFERPYAREIPEQDLRATAASMLQELDLEGLFRVRRPGPQRLIITRFDFWSLTRLTYHITEQRLVAEDQHFRFDQFLIRMHIRAGFVQESFLSDLWALVVDIVCIGFVLWVATGLYMWWLLPSTRRWGLLALGAGWLSFALFVIGL